MPNNIDIYFFQSLHSAVCFTLDATYGVCQNLQRWQSRLLTTYCLEVSEETHNMSFPHPPTRLRTSSRHTLVSRRRKHGEHPLIDISSSPHINDVAPDVMRARTIAAADIVHLAADGLSPDDRWRWSSHIRICRPRSACRLHRSRTWCRRTLQLAARYCKWVSPTRDSRCYLPQPTRSRL